MPLNKVGPGNMYQDFVTHTHSHLAGECPHKCQYCYVQDMARRFPVLAKRYSGPPRLVEKEFSVDYGKRWGPYEGSLYDKDTGLRLRKKTIFVENCSDLFADGIKSQWIDIILSHCCDYPENTYVFQTKNPGRINHFLNKGPYFPPRFMIGTTAESASVQYSFSNAPRVCDRLHAMKEIPVSPENKFVTIEPIMDFRVSGFLSDLLYSTAQTFYIGADSKRHGLPEPTGEEIGALVSALREAGKGVILKSNLKRLYKGE